MNSEWKRLLPPVQKDEQFLTFEAKDMMPGLGVGESCLIGVQVNRSHTRLVSTAGRAGINDGISEAAISQPAGLADILAQPPGSVELSSGSHGCVLTLTVSLGFQEGELCCLSCKEDLAYRKMMNGGEVLPPLELCSTWDSISPKPYGAWI